jgi:hypothetical protein
MKHPFFALTGMIGSNTLLKSKKSSFHALQYDDMAPDLRPRRPRADSRVGRYPSRQCHIPHAKAEDTSTMVHPRCLSAQDWVLAVARCPFKARCTSCPCCSSSVRRSHAAWRTAFITVAVLICQGWFCGMQYAHRALTVGKEVVPAAWILESVLSRPAHWVSGAVMSLSPFVEAKHCMRSTVGASWPCERY